MNPPLTLETTAPCCPALDHGVLDEAEAESLAATLKVLADPVRLRLISMLLAADAGEICACELPAALGRSQSTVSHHLTQLVNAGVLNREQRGKWAWFRLEPGRLAEIATALAGGPSPSRASARSSRF
ncbi:MAG TPA: metalloregulator ArsR/SmtB family transcription factor [Sporichthya sp.]|nr:metalloregulator ArsR/SmtB family transcription factor [Sporichthya sp.]